jgi:hypothetical protein
MANTTTREQQSKRVSHARILWVDQVEYAVRSRGAKLVALVANTMVAQLLYNSAGQLALGNGFSHRLPLRLGELFHGRLRPL